MAKGDLTRAMQSFIDVASIHMKDGARIETPIGSFAPKLRLDGDYTDPKKVKSDNVQFAGIEFIPSKEFVQSLADRIRHGFLQTGQPTPTEQLRDPEAMEKALSKALTKGYTTVNRFCYYSGLKYYTARRYLNSLCEGENPSLRRRKEGSVMHYLPVQKT